MTSRKVLHNGSVVETRLVRHRDKKVSIKRKVVGREAPPEPAVRPVLTQEQKTARQGTFLQRTVNRPSKPRITLPAVSLQAPAPIPATRSATKKARKQAKIPDQPPAPITARPKEFKERTHHEDSLALDKSAYVTTTNAVPKLLRRINARTGSHIEAFQRDYEMVGSDLRSSTMDGGGGGGSAGVPFPLAKVQALDRLREFERRSTESYRWCEAVLICGATPATIHKAGGPEHVVCSHLIRKAVDDLAGYYTPNRKRPDKTLAVIDKIIQEAARRV